MKRTRRRENRRQDTRNFTDILPRVRHRSPIAQTGDKVGPPARSRASDTTHYLRAESAAAAVDYAPEGFVASVGQHVSLEPPSRTGTPALHLAALPLADEIIASGLRVDVRYLKRTRFRPDEYTSNFFHETVQGGSHVVV